MPKDLPKGDSSKPLIEEVSSSESGGDWWQRKDNNYSAYDKPDMTVEEIERKMSELTAKRDELQHNIDQSKKQAEDARERV